MGKYIQFGVLVFLNIYFTHGCIFRSSWGVPSFNDGKESNSTNSTDDAALSLDKETVSVVQQTLVKTLISMGKLQFKCPQENGVFTDMLDCRKFYTCTNHNFTVEHCDSGTGYEPLAKTCINEESVPLCRKVQLLTDYKCNDTGLFIMEGVCEKFILCTGEAAYSASCNRGDYFDPKYKLCLPEGQVNCTGTEATS